METKELSKKFRTVAIIEGFSYLSFGITVPLREFLDLPLPNKIVGWIHGVLFIVYCVMLLILLLRKRFKFRIAVLLFIVSLIPFGTFWADPRFLRD